MEYIKKNMPKERAMVAKISPTNSLNVRAVNKELAVFKINEFIHIERNEVKIMILRK